MGLVTRGRFVVFILVIAAVVAGIITSDGQFGHSERRVAAGVLGAAIIVFVTVALFIARRRKG